MGSVMMMMAVVGLRCRGAGGAQCGLLNAKAVCSRTSWRVWAQVWRRFRGGRIGRKISSSM
jgi:hypothetical protein